MIFLNLKKLVVRSWNVLNWNYSFSFFLNSTSLFICLAWIDWPSAGCGRLAEKCVMRYMRKQASPGMGEACFSFWGLGPYATGCT